MDLIKRILRIKGFFPILGILLFAAHAWYLRCVAEDAFISFRYAKHLAQGAGLVWNLGESPIEGYTNFLWTLLCALFERLNLDTPACAQGTGIFFGILSLIYLGKMMALVPGIQTWQKWLPSLLYALCGPCVTWAGSGMETALFTWLLLATGYYFLAYQTSGQINLLAKTYVLLLLSVLTRPEGLILFAVLLFHSWNHPAFSTSKKTLLRANLLFIILITAYVAWKLWYFGDILPNTFYAKTGGHWHQVRRGLIYSGYFSLFFLFPLLPLWALSIWEKPLMDQPQPFKLFQPLFYLYTLYIIAVGGDYMAMFRFFVPLLPWIYLGTSIALIPAMNSALESRSKSLLLASLVILAAAATLLQSTPLEEKLFNQPRFQHGNYRGVQLERWHASRLALIGHYFNEVKHSSDESLLVNAIGAIGYYADLKINDIYGLVDPVIAHQKSSGKPIGSGFPGHEKKGDWGYLLSRKPTYILNERIFYHSPPVTPNFPSPWNDSIVKYYDLKAVWTRDSINGGDGYLSYLERKTP